MQVVNEAIDYKADVIITYHPILFRPVKRLVTSDPAAAVALRCLANNISVFSPHTALDSAAGGVNDWLCQCMGVEAATAPITAGPEDLPGSGVGRIATAASSVTMWDLVQSIKAHLRLRHVSVALPPSMQLDPHSRAPEALERSLRGVSVRTMAVCAGSGATVLRGVKADVYLTGELSHHEVLAANTAGTCVVLTHHSNTERGYLAVLAERLAAELGSEAEISISRTDHDPLTVV